MIFPFQNISSRYIFFSVARKQNPDRLLLKKVIFIIVKPKVKPERKKEVKDEEILKSETTLTWRKLS